MKKDIIRAIVILIFVTIVAGAVYFFYPVDISNPIHAQISMIAAFIGWILAFFVGATIFFVGFNFRKTKDKILEQLESLRPEFPRFEGNDYVQGMSRLNKAPLSKKILDAAKVLDLLASWSQPKELRLRIKSLPKWVEQCYEAVERVERTKITLKNAGGILGRLEEASDIFNRIALLASDSSELFQLLNKANIAKELAELKLQDLRSRYAKELPYLDEKDEKVLLDLINISTLCSQDGFDYLEGSEAIRRCDGFLVKYEGMIHFGGLDDDD